MKRKYFLLLLILLSVLQAGTAIDFTTLDTLFIWDDHPKYFSFSVENAKLLLDYGTPFGFNHNFQGGIPTFYLRSCFLELIPFALIFGYPLGYQLMLIVLLALIPLSFFYLVRQWTGKEDLALLAAFLASFYMTGDYLRFGMTPAIAGYTLTFLTLFFFSRYLSSKKPYLFPLLLSAAILAYTHLVFFVITGLACAAMLAIRCSESRPPGKTIRKAAWLAVILAIVLADLLYQLFYYRDYLRPDYATYDQLSAGQSPWGQFLYNVRELLFAFTCVDNHLLISVLVLGISLRFIPDEDKKRLIFRALFLSCIFLLASLLNNLTPVNIFIGRINSFTPYIFIYNLAMILWLPLGRYWQSFSLPLITIIFFYFYPFSQALLPTVKGMGDVDHSLASILEKGDFVLMENRSHICSVSGAVDGASYPHEHWETYLQRDLGIRMFANMGEDAHPYNNLRHMYVVNGCYREEPLNKENGAALTALMAQWGVRKACVWSPAAIAFFQGCNSFVPLGKSEYYTCFGGTYPAVSEVNTNGSAVGEVLDVTPFSFRVRLTGVKEKETMIVNKNYFPFWKAYDETGREVSLRADGQRISFDASRDGDIIFEFRRNGLLQFAALGGLIFAGGADLLQLLAVCRKRRNKKEYADERVAT